MQSPGDVARRPGVTALLREWRHRLVASDPGLVRLTSAARATVGVGSALVVEFVVAHLTGAPSALIPMLLGGVIAMMAAFGVSDPTRGARATTLAMLPLFMLAGMTVALLVDRVRVLALVTFVLVMMVAVAIRRFGPRYFIGGMVTFMGYFFALFLGLRLAQVPGILVAVLVGTAWAMVLSLVVLPLRHDRVLRRTVRAFAARVQGALGAADDLLEHRDDRHEDRLHDRLVAVTEAALMIEGLLGTPGAVADDAGARVVRHAVMDGELATRALVDAVRDLPDDARHDGAVRALLGHLGAGRWDAVPTAVADLGADDGTARVASVARGLLAARTEWRAAARGEGTPADEHAGREAPPFASAVELFGGFLPGSAVTVAAMRDAASEGRTPAGSWVSRLALPTRQALQVGLATALAVTLGDALSGQRWYWAVLATFLAFTGTATVAETVRKATHRIVGTMVGLLAAIPLVALTGTSPAVVVPVILLSIFCGFYLFKVSYALMIFFITLLVGELYALLGTFTPSLMVLRLEETVLGGVIGMGVALVVMPTRTRAAATGARRELLDRLTTLLDDVDRWLRRAGDPRDPDDAAIDLAGDVRALDAAVHQMLTVAAPLTRTALLAPDRETRRRLATYTAVAHHAGRLGRATQAVARGTAPDGGAAQHLARLAASFGGEIPRVPRAAATAVGDLLARADRPGRPCAPLARELVSLHEAITTLADVRGYLTDAPDGPAGSAGSAGRVRGRVLGPAREPVAATVTVVDRDGRGHAHTTTDADGTYTLDLPATGSGQLVVVPGRGVDAAPRAVRIATGASVAAADVVLPARTAGRPAPVAVTTIPAGPLVPVPEPRVDVRFA